MCRSVLTFGEATDRLVLDGSLNSLALLARVARRGGKVLNPLARQHSRRVAVHFLGSRCRQLSKSWCRGCRSAGRRLVMHLGSQIISMKPADGSDLCFMQPHPNSLDSKLRGAWPLDSMDSAGFCAEKLS